jgi:alpha-tubulin suppressor-like RCC1 family protein
MTLARKLEFKIIALVSTVLILSGCSLSMDLQKLFSVSETPVLNIENKTPAIVANATNISAVPVSGKCTTASGNVTVQVDQLYNKTITCLNDAWTDTLDLTSLADKDDYELTATQTVTGVSATDSAVLMVDTVLPLVTGITDTLLPVASLSSGWSCTDTTELCKFRYMVTNNPVFSFTTELYDATNTLLQLSHGQSYVYVQAVDKANNYSTPVRVDTYIGEPKIFIGGLYKTTTATGIEDLNILAASSLTEMAIFNNALCTGTPTWIPRTNLVAGWNLDPASLGGTASVSVKFRTTGGQVSSCYSDTILWPNPSVFRMCSSTTSSLSSGILYDSGGPSANYADNENCTMTLTLPGSAVFTFESMSIETNWDFLKVLDGGVEVLSLTGNTAPPPLTTTGTTVQFKFTSDSSVNESGFKISWAAAGASSGVDTLSLNINNGDAVAFTDAVSANLTYDSIFHEVYLTENGTCSTGGTWSSVAAQKPWTFSTATNGTHELYAKFRDVFGNESFCEGDSIVLSTPEITIDSHANGALVQSIINLGGYCSAPGNVIEITGSATASTTCANDETWTAALDVSATANGGAVAFIVNLKSGATIAASAAGNYVVSRSLAITSPAASAYVSTGFTVSGTCNTDGTTIESSSPSVASTLCTGGAWSLNLTTSGNDGDTVSTSVSMKIGTTVQQTKTRSFILSTAAPTATITGAPSGTSIATTISIAVGGTNVDKYKYKFGSGIVCSDASGYSAEIAVATGTTLDQSALANGTVTLCVIGHSSINGVWQAASAASTASWVKDSEVTASLATANAVVTEGATGLQLTANLSGTKLVDVRVYYSYYGKNVYLVDHNLAEGYITVPAGQLTASIYFDTYGNALADGDREVRVYLTHTNNGAVTLARDVIADFYIKDDDQTYKTILKATMTGNHLCAVYSDGKLLCWGGNDSGELGVGDKSYRAGTVEPYPAEQFMDVAATLGSTCAITTGKKMFCWGANWKGQLGTGDTTSRLTPTAVDATENYVQVASRYSQSVCALTEGGKIKCWGENTSGQVGIGNTTNQSLPMPVDAANTYSSVIAMGTGACGITTAGVLKCWGGNAFGQLISGSTANQTSPVIIDSGTTYSSIAENGSLCGITTAGVLKCWGHNDSYQIPGAAGTTVTSRATVVDVGTTYKRVAVEWAYTCGITSTDDLKCWGGEIPGIFNLAQLNIKTTPTLIPENIKFKELYSTNTGLCGISLAGDFICMGDYMNQVFESRYTVSMSDIDPFSTIANYSVGDNTTCAINSAGTASCFGTYSGTAIFRPTRVIAEMGASYTGGNVFATSKGACLIDAAGAMKCAGTWGALGDGGSVESMTFKSIAPTVAFAMTGRDAYYCAAGINTAGKIYGWASSCGGTTPTALDTSTTYQNILAVAGHVCSITTANDMKCWGYDGGEGNLAGSSKSSPSVMDSGTKYKNVVVANSFTCGITTGDKLKCWGRGGGRLGNGGTGNTSSPVAVDSANNYAKVSAGVNSICAITTGGVLKCWGYVGDYMTPTTYTTPQIVTSGTTYQDVAVSTDSIMAITSTGEMRYWPFGRFDQSFQVMAPGKAFKSVKAHYAGSMFCGMATDDHVYCSSSSNWGADQVGRAKLMPFTRWLQ